MAILTELQGLLPQLGNPRFLHFLLEPLLLWGVLIGSLGWILSVGLLRQRRAQVCSLWLLACSAFAVLPVLHFRREAAPITAPSARLLKEQNERRRDTQWVYLGLGSLALIGLFATGEGKGKSGTFFSLAIAGAGLSTAVFSLWLQEKEVAIFHPDARRALRPATIEIMENLLRCSALPVIWV